MAETLVETRQTLQEIQDEAYARLQLSESAPLSQIVKAIDRREESRQHFNAYGPADVQEADVIYSASLTRGIQNELARCLELSEKEPLEGLKVLTEHLRAVQDVPLSEKRLKELDETFFDLALETLADTKSTPIEQAASVTLSLQFGANRRGVAKTQMILEQRLAAEQAANLSHINRASQQATSQRLDAMERFFAFAGLEYDAQIIDSTMSASVQKAAERARNSIEKSKQTFNEGAKLGQKVASVTVLASMGVVGGASMAAAETPSSTEASVSAEAEIIAQSIATNQQILEVPVVAAVEAVTEPGQASPIEVPATTSVVDVDGAVVAVDVATVTVGSITSESTTAPTPSVEAKPAVAKTPEATPETEAQPAPAIGYDTPAAEAPAFVEAAPSVEPEVIEKSTQEAAAPPTVTVPNSDVNVAVGETPKEALARIVASRDMNAASYAIRKLYSPTPDQAPINEKLSTIIAADGALLRINIAEVKHGDAAYTEKAYFALAYLDAVTRSPALLDNPEVAAFVASIKDQGEDYRNKLFAQYLAEAKAKLSTEDAGAYNGVAEQYRESIEALYAYTAMAGVSDQKQAEQIEAIKAEEARIAAEAEARRIAAEQAQQGLSPIEIIAADEKQLVLNGIERARQNRIITDRYANVARLVVEQEGPGALVAAAGMIGNCMAEADGCNPEIIERGNGIGYGIFQWSFERRGTLERTAQSQGVYVGEIGFQVPYAIAESKNRSQRDNRSLNEWQGMMEQTDAGAAAEFWRWNFERPKEHLSRANTRVQVALEVHAGITGQIDAIKGEAAAAKAAREAEIERQRVEQERLAEEARQAALAGDMRPQLVDGFALRDALEAIHGGTSGKLDQSELVAVAGFDEHGEPDTLYMHPEVAKGYVELAAAYKAHFGEDLRATDHYRNYDEQVDVKRRKPKLAAKPGTSNHGWGMALDLASSINVEGSPQHEWMEDNAHKYGFINPPWHQDDKGPKEPWHWEFEGSKATWERSNVY